MAKDAKASSGIPLQPAGINDNSPLSADPEWYQSNGVHSISELCLQRCNGKALFQKFDSPILAIHGDLRNRVYVETTTQLLMLDSLTPVEPIPPDDDMAIEDYILIKDIKPAGDSGGNFFSGAYYTRDLNLEEVDTGNFAAIASNQITLAPGTYRCQISVPGFDVGEHRALLYNITDDEIALLGSSEFSNDDARMTTRSVIVGRFILTDPTVFEIRHYCGSGDSQGFGHNVDDAGSNNEVYTIAEFWRAPSV